MTRVVLFTGKSGSGVSTIAAATALRCADEGRRTALFRLAPAPPQTYTELGAPLLGASPHLAIIDAPDEEGCAPGWQALDDWLARLLHDRAPGGPPVRLRDLPGFLHLLGLLALLARVERGRFEVMIVDCPPAPETVQLLRLGDALGWTVQPATTAHALARLARPLVSRVANLPDADTALATLDEVRARLVRLRAVLQDGARSSIRLLSTSRRTDAAVLRHAYRVLRLFEYPVDAVITNSLPSVLPATRHPLHDDAAAPRWLTVPAWAEEPNTPDALRALAAALYGDHGPALVLTPSPSVEVLTLDGRVALRVPLPLTEPQHAGATQVGDYVTIRAADAHRTIPLPPLLRDRTCTGARLEGGAMTLLFA